MQKKIMYHGSSSRFDKFDPSFGRNHHNMFGSGFYFTEDPAIARNYGDNVYKVELSYSTDYRTAKRTGREMDYNLVNDGAYMVIPYNKAQNIKILDVADVSDVGPGDAQAVLDKFKRKPAGPTKSQKKASYKNRRSGANGG